MARNKLDQWKGRMTEWQDSGQTREVYCRERDLRISTFSYWRTKINKLESSESETTAKKDFIRYRLPTSTSSQITIGWPDGMKLQLPIGINLQELAEFILVIKDHR
jgi:hypothetical protein